MSGETEELSVTLTAREWIEISAALTYTAINDRQEGREDMADTMRRIRENIRAQIKEQRG